MLKLSSEVLLQAPAFSFCMNPKSKHNSTPPPPPPFDYHPPVQTTQVGGRHFEFSNLNSKFGYWGSSVCLVALESADTQLSQHQAAKDLMCTHKSLCHWKNIRPWGGGGGYALGRPPAPPPTATPQPTPIGGNRE